MTCPSCSDDVTLAPIAGHLTVCPSCARSLVLDGETVRVALAADVHGVSPEDLARLRAARPSSWRQAVQARKAELSGRRGR
jgi:hypothetical protein